MAASQLIKRSLFHGNERRGDRKGAGWYSCIFMRSGYEQGRLQRAYVQFAVLNSLCMKQPGFHVCPQSCVPVVASPSFHVLTPAHCLVAAYPALACILELGWQGTLGLLADYRADLPTVCLVQLRVSSALVLARLTQPHTPNRLVGVMLRYGVGGPH